MKEKTIIYDFDIYKKSNSNNSLYGKDSCFKEYININDEVWIIKFPKKVKGMYGGDLSSTYSHLSEYMGSHIYNILGISVHQSLLGIRDNRLVVACRDFCKEGMKLLNFDTIKNQNVRNLTTSPQLSNRVDINLILSLFRNDPILKNITDIEDWFWQQLIVDILIDNNQRIYDNWGIISYNHKYFTAPVYANDSSFSYNLSDEIIKFYMKNPEKLEDFVNNTNTIYIKGDKELFAKDINEINNINLQFVASKLIPKIGDKLKDIEDFINNIPSKFGSLKLCSNIRKDFYITTMKMRYEKFLLPLVQKKI